MEKYGTAKGATGDNTTGRMRIECWRPMATNTHSEYVIINGLPQRYWLHERAQMLRLYVQCHSDNTIGRMRIECWIPMATNTHSEYVIIKCLPQRHWLHDRAPMLRLYVECLSSCSSACDVLSRM